MKKLVSTVSSYNNWNDKESALKKNTQRVFFFRADWIV